MQLNLVKKNQIMNICETIAQFIPRHSDEIFSSSVNRDMIEIKIKIQSNFGLHVANSPRFICYLRASSDLEKVEGKILFIKNRGNVNKEYENMKSLWSQHYSRNELYIIPKPISLDSKNSLLFMENIKGDSFLNIYYKYLFSIKNKRLSLIKEIKMAARWLTDFQSIYCSEDKKHIPRELCSYKNSLEIIGELEHREKRNIIRKMDAIIGDCPQYYHTYIHDQFLFRNIIFYDDKICVVDFPHLRRGWPLFDYFSFLIGIDRLVQYPFISKSLCEIFKDYFTSEYIAKSSIEYDQEVFENLWALFVVTYLKKRYPRHSGIRGVLNRKFVNNTLRKIVAWSRK